MFFALGLAPAAAEHTAPKTTCAADDTYCQKIQRLRTADPLKDAFQAIAKGDFRLRCSWDSHWGGASYDCGVHCMLWLYDVDHGPDSPVNANTVESRWNDQAGEFARAAVRYSYIYNRALLAHPNYPDSDVCRMGGAEDDEWDDHFGDTPKSEFAPKKFEDVATAARFGRIEEVRRLLNVGKSPIVTDKFGMAAIQWAAARGFGDIVDLLLAQPGFSYDPSYRHNSPEILAARFGRLGVFKKILQPRYFLDHWDNSPAVFIKLATERGSIDVVRYLLDEVPQVIPWAVRHPVEKILTEMAFIAAARGHADLLAFYLDRGVDIEATTPYLRDTETLLYRAIREWKPRSVRLLLSRGAMTSPNTLAYAVYWGDHRVIEALLDHGLDVNAMGGAEDSGKIPETPLMWASYHCWSGYRNHALLIARGADPNIHDQEGRTALILAIKTSDINQDGTTSGMTSKIRPDMPNAVPGHLECIRMLLENGADPNGSDVNGDSALHYAAKSEYHAPTIELLLTKNGSINARNKDGKTPLDIALENGLERNPKLLIAHGAKRGAP